MKSTSLKLVQELSERLSSVYQDPILCTQYAWWTLEAITQKPQATLLAMREIELTLDQCAVLESWLHAMIDKHMPIQYLIGSVPFADLSIKVQSPILIPRPETEEWVIKLIEQLQPLKDAPLHILDLCSGTGCIALALGKALPNARIVGGDNDERAILLARENAHTNNINNVTFVLSDLYDQLPINTRYALIVSNPPYISQHAWHSLDASVTTWESHNALVADDHGLAIIKRIINRAPYYLRPCSALEKHTMTNLFIEIGFDQGNAVAQFMKNANIADVMIHKDLEGKDRVVSGSVVHVATANDAS